jgi:dsDNA-binding SOS-regulon protein
MLNEGLRPHLTMWQAKYRRWYSNALEEGKEKSPQETQREYPSYDGLIDDLKATNQRMVSYGGLLHEIAFEN